MFDAVFGAQTSDALFDMSGETLISQNHICPHRIAADFGTDYAAQHRAEGRFSTPRSVAMPGVFVRVFGITIEQQQFRMVRMAGYDGVPFKSAEATRKGHVNCR